MSRHGQGEFLLDPSAPARLWDQDVAKRALDELFSLARQYRTGEDFAKLIRFVTLFRAYSPFNAMLVHLRMPGATYVAPASRWLWNYRRRIKAEARPLVILQPMGPVMFVFDVSDTEPEAGTPQLPREVTHPFEVRRGRVGKELTLTIDNVKRDGVSVSECAAGSQSAGEIRTASPGRKLSFSYGKRLEPKCDLVPLRYELLLNRSHSPEAKYATLAHELGHLYCGHLGTPEQRWWPDRRGLPEIVAEFEAESVCYLVCGRAGLHNPSEEYLASYLKPGTDVPPVSLECVMKAAGLIEHMGRGPLMPRKKKE